MIKRMSLFVALVLLASGTAQAANTLSLGDQAVTLVWDASWQAYSYYGQFTCSYGQPYVFWVTGGDGSYMTEAEASDAYSTKTSFSSLQAGGITYNYVSADGWKAVDAGKSHLYNFNTLHGKTGCSVVVHVRQGDVLDFVPVGSAYKPEVLDFSTAGSCERTQLTGELGYFFRANIKANTNYTLTSSLGMVAFAVEDESAVVSQTEVSGGVAFASDRDASVVVRVSSNSKTEKTVDLSWKLDDVGRIGFEQTGYVVDDLTSFVTAIVTRTSADFSASVKWYTVAETADPGVNYLPGEGTLQWEKGDLSSRQVVIRILPDLHPCDRDGVTFAIRLVPDDDAGDSLHQPVIQPDITRVTIGVSGAVEPEPVVPSAVDDSPEMPLADGTFEGVLIGGTGDTTTNGVWALGALSLTADAAGRMTATLTINGIDFAFSGQGDELTGASACAGMVNRLTVRLPSGTVGDLAEGPVGGAEICATVYLNLNGQVVEATYDGTAYRVANRRYSVTMDRVKDLAGRYTVALRGDQQLGAPSGYGYLSFDVTPAGEVSGLGRLADGTAFDFTAFANETERGLEIPLLVANGTASFGGTLVIEEGAASGTLLWCEDLQLYGGDGEHGFRMELSPLGGKYDATARLEAQYFGWLLAVNDRSSAFRDLTLSVSGETFVADGEGYAVDFVRTTGVLRVVGTGGTFEGILLPTVEDGMLAAAGCEVSENGSRACELFAEWTDPVQPEYRGYATTVTFNLNGGEGNVDPITREVGGEAFSLPVEGEYGIELADRVLAGWERSDTHELYNPGTRLHPPIQDITLTAVWSRKLNIADALCCTYLDYLATSSDKIWVEDPDEHPQPGERSIRNETLSYGETAEFAAVLKGAGTLIFKYRVSGSDPFTVTLDGNVILSTSSDTGWTSFAYSVTAPGSHIVKFAYARSSQRGSGSAWLAALGYGTPATVKFDPNDGGTPSAETKIVGRPIGFLPVLSSALRDFVGWANVASGEPVDENTLVSAGGMELVAQWEPRSWTLSFSAPDATSGDVPSPICKKEGETVTIPGAGSLERTSYELVGWSDGTTTYVPGSVYTFGAQDITMTAVWKFSTKDIARTLGAENVEFETTEERGWVVDGSSVRSNNKGQASTTSTLTARFSGAGTLTFTYKVSSYVNPIARRTIGNDYLTVSVDGAQVYSNCGSGEEMSYPSTHLDEGDHVVVLSYAKDYIHDANDDCGYVYTFSWRPDGPNPPQIDGKTVDPAEVVSSMDSRKVLTLDADFTQVSGNTVTYGTTKMIFPDYYVLTMGEPTGGKVAVMVALDPGVATPQVDGSVDSPIIVGSETVSVAAANVKKGLWYYLQTAPSLDVEFSLSEGSVIQASESSGKLVVTTDRVGDGLFMKVGVCDYDPREK